MKTYDYVVIGAGSSGCVIASRLSEDPHARVLVIDAGTSDDSALFRRPGMLALIYQVPKLKEKTDWGYKTVPSCTDILTTGCFTNIGTAPGTSVVNPGVQPDNTSFYQDTMR